MRKRSPRSQDQDKRKQEEPLYANSEHIELVTREEKDEGVSKHSIATCHSTTKGKDGFQLQIAYIRGSSYILYEKSKATPTHACIIASHSIILFG